MADDPTNDKPENPEPSRPVKRPTPDTVAVAMVLFRGTELARAIPKSLIIP